MPGAAGPVDAEVSGTPLSFTAVWDDFSGRWCCWRDVWKVTLPWSWSARGIFLWDDNFVCCILPRWFNLMWFVVSSAHLWNSRASELTFCQALLKSKFGPSNPLDFDVPSISKAVLVKDLYRHPFASTNTWQAWNLHRMSLPKFGEFHCFSLKACGAVSESICFTTLGLQALKQQWGHPGA